jgi:hypothetical protein
MPTPRTVPVARGTPRFGRAPRDALRPDVCRVGAPVRAPVRGRVRLAGVTCDPVSTGRRDAGDVPRADGVPAANMSRVPDTEHAMPVPPTAPVTGVAVEPLSPRAAVPRPSAGGPRRGDG